MKKLILLITSVFCFQLANAQNSFVDTRKFIEVNGSAEMSLQPDEIDLEITIQEFDRAGKKVKLDDVNNDFIKLLKTNKINTEDLEFVSSTDDYYWWYWWWHRYDQYQTKTIVIKLTPQTNILKLVEDLHTKWVQNIRIARSSHSKLREYRKQVKAEAAKAAKEKATYLLESLDEELGNVLSVEEVPDVTNNPYNYWGYSLGNSLVSNSNVSVPSGGSSGTKDINNVDAIKLRYEIKVKFAIK